MGKKSETDRLREEFFRREMRRRKALDGPFRCPKCQVDKKLQCRKVSMGVKEIRTPINGEPYEIIIPHTEYIFYCTGCRFRRAMVRKAGGHSIDVYNTLYDEEISAANREGQLALIRDRRPRVVTLPATEVRMR